MRLEAKLSFSAVENLQLSFEICWNFVGNCNFFGFPPVFLAHGTTPWITAVCSCVNGILVSNHTEVHQRLLSVLLPFVYVFNRFNSSVICIHALIAVITRLVSAEDRRHQMFDRKLRCC